MDEVELKQRTKQFALRVMRLVENLPKTPSGRVIGQQLLRSGTSVGANYRSACRGRSKVDFIAKAGISLEEADESLYWMELLMEAKLIPQERLQDIMKEANELVAIFNASIKTARMKSSQEDRYDKSKI